MLDGESRWALIPLASFVSTGSPRKPLASGSADRIPAAGSGMGVRAECAGSERREKGRLMNDGRNSGRFARRERAHGRRTLRAIAAGYGARRAPDQRPYGCGYPYPEAGGAAWASRS